MKLKIIVYSVIAILIVGYVVYSQYTIHKLQETVNYHNTQKTIADNSISEPADNRDELLKEKDDLIAELNIKLKAKHNAENFQLPPLKEPGVDEFVEFGPDPIPEEVFNYDPRIAEFSYEYRDEANEYSATFDILFEYNRQNFIITPSELTYEETKNYPFCVMASINSNSYELSLSYDLFRRIRIGSNVGLTREVEPVVGISIGITF